MRTIKFRAWNKFEEHEILGEGEMVTEENSGLSSANILDRFDVVMQYTGLKDKNGKEIYEGDVVRVKYNTSSWGRKINYNFVGEIKFGSFMSHEKDGCFDEIEGWYISVSPHGQKESLGNHDYASEVIGNIHEHPELLGAKTEV